MKRLVGCGRGEKWGRTKEKRGAVYEASRLRMKCDSTRAETRFRLSAKPSPFKSAGASVLFTTGRRDVRISGSNAGYTVFRGSVKSTGYPLHSPVSPSLPHPWVTVCRHIWTALYLFCDTRCQWKIPVPNTSATRTSRAGTFSLVWVIKAFEQLVVAESYAHIP